MNIIIDKIDLWSTAQTLKSSNRGLGASNQSLLGIKRLRELILGLSLRGLFEGKNESNPKTIENDIFKARKSYFNSIGKKPRDYIFGPAILDEYNLPSGWIWKRVGELCDLQTGATPSTQKKEFYNGDIRWLVSGDINQEVIFDCEGRITDEGLRNSNCKILPPDTVLIALNGQGKTRASVAILKVPAACNQSLVGIIPFSNSILDSTFLLLALKYRYYEIRDITGQNQRRGLNMGLVSELSVPLAPLAEQHRIVAKVDELMALCDELEQQQTESNTAHQTLVETLLGTLTQAESPAAFDEAWQRIATHFDTLLTTEHSIDQLKQTILQLAVMGKLAPQNPNDEPASELLKKIVKEKTSQKKKNQSEVKGLRLNINEDAPFKIPNGWIWCKSEFLFSFEQGIQIDKDLQLTINLAGHQRFLRIVDYTQETDDIRYVKDPGNKYLVNKDSLVMVRYGASAGFVGSEKEGVLANNLFKIIYYKLDKLYVMKFFQSPYFLNELSNNMQGAAMPAINFRFLNKLLFPLPPLIEQHRIVSKVDELFALCDALKDHLRESQIIQAQLASAVVEGALKLPKGKHYQLKEDLNLAAEPGL